MTSRCIVYADQELRQGESPLKELPPSCLNRLKAWAKRSPGPRGQPYLKIRADGTFKIGSWCGFITLGSLTLEILPTLSIDPHRQDSRQLATENLITMLSTSHYLSLDGTDAKTQSSDASLADALVRHFAIKLKHALHQRPDSAYASVRERRPGIHGRILWDASIARYGTVREVFVQHTWRLQENTSITRVLAVACNFLLAHIRSPDVRQDLRYCLSLLPSPVSLTIGSVLAERLTFHRNNHHFRRLAAFSRQILQHQGPHSRKDDVPSFGFLVQLPRLFEHYVTSLLKRHRRRLGLQRCDIIAQSSDKRRYLATEGPESEPKGRFSLRPDILIMQDDVPLCIIDLKWKSILQRRTSEESSDKFSRVSEKRSTRSRRLKSITADCYQMLSYAVGTGSKHCILLYPGRKQKVRSRTFRWKDRCGSLKIAEINLNRSLRHNLDEVLNDLFALLRAGGVV